MESLKYYLFNDSRPYHGKSTPVQKGVVPSMKGGDADVCEEGLGFGVPILQCTRDFYFPGTGNAEPAGEIYAPSAKKSYEFNLIERLQADSHKIRHFTWVVNRLNLTIFKSKAGRKILELPQPLIRRLSAFYKLEPPAFIRVRSHGIARVTYDVDKLGHRININADFSSIHKQNLQRIYISNELGGKAFTHYYDGSGIRLQANQIGEWNKIEAAWAILYSPILRFGYKIDIPPGLVAYRGRETNMPDLCWSGIILSISPKLTHIKYAIELGSLRQLTEGKWK
ncbi:MAG TPA: hypothetical protein VKM55_00860 [Candidatus Lokiarchaeia archaeon]|nr:hypothetical protein [Candidatus Lokiarchaeia archaeon]